MRTLTVHDHPAPAAGPAGTDPLRVLFDEDLAWVEACGLDVARVDLGPGPAEPLVQEALDRDGEDALPVLVFEGRVVCRGGYPSRAQLAGALGLEWHEPASPVGAVVTELASLAAAVASDCHPAFQHHLRRCQRLGLEAEDVLKVVNLAFSIKAMPHRAMVDLAERMLLPGGGGGCCGGGGGCSEGGCGEDCECEEGGCGEEGCGCAKG